MRTEERHKLAAEIFVLQCSREFASLRNTTPCAGLTSSERDQGRLGPAVAQVIVHLHFHDDRQLRPSLRNVPTIDACP